MEGNAQLAVGQGGPWGRCSASHPSPAPPRLLWSALRSLGPLQRDVEAMTREQGKATGAVMGAEGLVGPGTPAPQHPLPHSPALPLRAP